ncbi:glutathione transferase GstA [Pseudomonas capeferrum]|uniref:glutathione transferase GstA n=1 Tax=Pseudomonas capeferrum TaxID=1495066 RepID=UPI0015E45F64|nr:glutathione transferase GstA [Pseudomonas capeferrum]MBA1200684.1 glutathione transferase GstA [Pseudomonas capeferrum]
MKLFYLTGACSLAPHIVLRETNTPFDLVKVDRTSKQTDTGENYLEINPKGYVPALQLDDGRVVTEAQVVLQYLAAQHPDSELAPEPGSAEHYQLLEMLSFVSTELHKTMGSLFDPKQTPEWRAAMTELLGKRLDWLSEQLEGREFLFSRFTVADAYLFTVLNWAAKVKVDLAPWPSVAAYHQRLSQRPSVQQAMKAEGLL